MAHRENFPWALGRRALAVGAPLLVVAACSTGPAPAGDPTEAPALAPAVVETTSDFRLETEPLIGVRFPVLAAGVSVDVRHFDPTLPAGKFRHSIRLATEAGPVVLIEVWDNPQRLALRPWFDATLGFLAQETTKQSERPMSSAHLPGILLEEPASPQAGSQAIAVFAAGAQVFRVTAINPEGDPVAKRLFERIVDQIEPGVRQ